jgi:HlyD family secretion protein
VNAQVDEADVAQIRLGQKVNITLDAFPDDEFKGVVRRIDPRGATDQNITTILTQVEILKPNPNLRPGLNSECEFIVTEKKDVLVVPARAVRSERGGGGAAKAAKAAILRVAANRKSTFRCWMRKTNPSAGSHHGSGIRRQHRDKIRS